VPQLSGLRRRLSAAPDGGLLLEDTFRFSANPLEIEEALISWGEVELAGSAALIRRQHHSLRLTLLAPTGAAFAVQALAAESQANDKPAVLKRITLTLPPALETTVRIKIEVIE
jgi:hypothetical protein